MTVCRGDAKAMTRPILEQISETEREIFNVSFFSLSWSCRRRRRDGFADLGYATFFFFFFFFFSVTSHPNTSAVECV